MPISYLLNKKSLEKSLHPFSELSDAVLGTAYLLLFLFLETFFELHEKSGHSLHCQQVFPENNGNHCSVSMKIVEFNACPQNSWKLMQRVHENCGIQCLSMKFVEFTVCTLNRKLYCFSFLSNMQTELFEKR